jgi:hypothetical protein
VFPPHSWTAWTSGAHCEQSDFLIFQKAELLFQKHGLLLVLGPQLRTWRPGLWAARRQRNRGNHSSEMDLGTGGDVGMGEGETGQGNEMWLPVEILRRHWCLVTWTPCPCLFPGLQVNPSPAGIRISANCTLITITKSIKQSGQGREVGLWSGACMRSCWRSPNPSAVPPPGSSLSPLPGFSLNSKDRSFKLQRCPSPCLLPY